MAEFFGGRLLRWLTMPYRMAGKRGARMVNLASKPFYQVADRILGSQFLEDIAEFFLNFQAMYPGFVERAQAVERLLHDRRTTFVVVTTLEAAPLREAEYFTRALAARNLHLGAMVLNKTLPDRLLSETAATAARRLCADPRSGDPAADRVLHTVGESFLNFSVVAKREAELRAELAIAPDLLLSVPYFEVDICDLSGLGRIGTHLFTPQ
jgi:anion-transporting  ArsA/GET3 family ATPase